MIASPADLSRDGFAIGAHADEVDDLDRAQAPLDNPDLDHEGDPDACLAGAVGDDITAAGRAAGPPRTPRLPFEAGEEQIAAWIDRVVDRDERALAALYDATLSRVYGLVLRVVRRPALADEVVEDTYFQVWRQAARFDPARGRALPWLLGMARSRAIDAVRREARFQHVSLDLEAAHGLAEGTGAEVGPDRLVERIDRHAADDSGCRSRPVRVRRG